jgi:hypothetical protein
VRNELPKKRLFHGVVLIVIGMITAFCIELTYLLGATLVSAGDAGPEGAINGSVFNDQNANGQIDLSDPGLAGWTVQLFSGICASNGPIVSSQISDSAGAVGFGGLAGGAYCVKEVLQSGWIETYPNKSTPAISGGPGDSGTSYNGMWDVMIGVNSTLGGVEFGNTTALLTLTPTRTATFSSTGTATSTATRTATITGTPTETSTQTTTSTVPYTSTSISTPTSTAPSSNTPTSTATPIATATDALTSTATPTSTTTPTRTLTNTSTATATSTGSVTVTATDTETRTLVPTNTPTYTPGLPTLTPTATPPTGTNTLTGTAQDQRVPTPVAVHALELRLEFRLAGSPSGNPPQFVLFTTTQPDGSFIRSGVPDGSYDVRLKHWQAVSMEKRGLVFGGGNTVPVPFGLLRAGDADQNDGVSAADFTVLKGSFTQPTECATQNPIPSPCADFDANRTVGPNDFSLLKANFGLTGPLLLP